MSINRCCVFAHYDKDNLVDPYVYNYLKALKPYCSKIILVSTSQLSDSDKAQLEKMGVNVTCRPNVGYDFLSWKVGMDQITFEDYDEVLQVNDSCYAPLFSFDEIFSTMDNVACDFWGITRSYEIKAHIQSYFVCYRKPILCSEVFKQFWSDLKIIENKQELIMSYEVGLSQLLLKENFQMGHFFKAPVQNYLKITLTKIIRFILELRVKDFRRLIEIYILPKSKEEDAKAGTSVRISGIVKSFYVSNPTHHYYREMLNQKVPIIKIELIRDNPMKLPMVDLHKVKSINKETVSLLLAHQKRVSPK